MKDYRSTKAAAYTVNVSMSVVATLSPLLFSTFYDMYGISYGLLGLLVFINFCTQLAIDLIFSFYSHKFNIKMTVRIMPLLTAAGLMIYAVMPIIYPQSAYIWLAAGTVVFSVSSGLSEVLISPIIASIPSDNPKREMSKLHSIYAWGVVIVVIISTLTLKLIGRENWYWLPLIYTLIPLVAFLMFSRSELPEMATPEKASKATGMLKNRALIICVLCIFFGGASECTMSQWSSGYIEQALGLSKVWGDIFGVAMFGATLGLGRSLFGTIGKNVYGVVICGSAGAAVCYLVASLTTLPVLGLIACAMTGLCTSMLWPGSLLVASDNFPNANIAVFALMAAGGDMGAAIGPQLTGIVADAVISSGTAAEFAARLGLTPEQLGMKAGILSCTLFPVFATVFFIIAYKIYRRRLADTANF